MPNFREINCPHCGLIVAIPEPHTAEDERCPDCKSIHLCNRCMICGYQWDSSTTEDNTEDAIEHYAIGGSPIDYTPEDECENCHGTGWVQYGEKWEGYIKPCPNCTPTEDEPSRYQTALEVQAEYLKELNKYSKEKSWEEGQSQSGLFMWLSEKITGG